MGIAVDEKKLGIVEAMVCISIAEHVRIFGIIQIFTYAIIVPMISFI